MCGIAGMLRLDGGQVDADALRAMNAMLVHRGPDDGGVWSEGEVGLANRRLAVIGLGPQGHQPMSDESGRIWITYNGEIYNYRDVAADLRGAGERLWTETDTEVILLAYRRWGLTPTLARLNGMFAFAIWDARDHTLHLARDRLGIKPLYVDRSARRALFASELNAIAVARGTAAELDPGALDAYLAVGYVPEPRTIWRSTSAVVPGHAITWHSGRERTARYWALQPAQGPAPSTLMDAAERVRTTVDLAVRRQLVSDVPVGVFLSGGLDSAIVAHAAATARPGIEGFTAHFDDPAFDESEAAKRTARRLGIRHHVEDVAVSLWPQLRDLVRSFGQPFADSSALALSALSSAARRRMTVALSGDGGDELFAGYPTYAASALAPWYRLLPGGVRALVRGGAARLPVTHAKLGLVERIQRFTTGADDEQPLAHLRWREHVGPAERGRLLGPAGAPLLEVFADGIAESATFRGGDRYLALDLLTYLRSDILRKVDIASMRHSLEVRVPLLDHEVVELAFSLPYAMKRRGLTGKRVLRAAFRGVLPPTALAGKRGFNVPISSWLAGPLHTMAHDVFSSRVGAIDLVDRRRALQLLAEHRDRRADHGAALWTLLVLFMWDEHGARPKATSASAAREVWE